MRVVHICTDLVDEWKDDQCSDSVGDEGCNDEHQGCEDDENAV